METKTVINTIPLYEGTAPLESWRWIVEMDGEPIHVPVVGWINVQTITNSSGDSVTFLLDHDGNPVYA